MRAAFRIARLELGMLFYSPVAWLVLIIFIFQSGINFTGLLQRYESYSRMGWDLKNITTEVFIGMDGFFHVVKSNLYYYVPLLTMGLISREISSGSIKLLYSSPVTVRQVVFGKFMGMMAYGSLLSVILMLFTVAANYSIVSMDIMMVISGIMGLFLLICAYSSIGLFMSSLTSYQVVAAISTLVVLAMLSYIGTVGQTIPVIRDLVYFLSIAGRTDTMLSGLISSKDVLYFFIVIAIFLGLTIFNLRHTLESRSIRDKTIRYVAFLSVMLFLGYLSSRQSLVIYYDMTATKSRTLTENSQQVVAQMTEPLKITTYVNLFDAYREELMPSQHNRDKDRFEMYNRFLPGMTMDYVYFYDTTDNEYLFQQNAGLTLDKLAIKLTDATGDDLEMFFSPKEIKKKIDLGAEENRDVRLLEYKGNKTFLRFFYDMEHFPAEKEITGALKGLISTRPKILFLTGNMERHIYKNGDREYKRGARTLNFRHALINQGFSVDTFAIDKGDVPTDICALVIADPRIEFSSEEISRIAKYIESGGNMIIAGEPGRKDIINPLLSLFGVQMTGNQLLQQSKDNEPDFVLADIAPLNDTMYAGFNSVAKRGRKITMPGVAALHFTAMNNYKADTIIISKVMGPALSNGDIYHNEPLALALTKQFPKKQQRIMVFGDADILSNAELNRYNMENANFAVGEETYKWLSYGAFPVDTSRPPTFDNSFSITRNGIFMLKIIFMGILPAILLAGGAFVLIKRRNR